MKKLLQLIPFLAILLVPSVLLAASGHDQPAYHLEDGSVQYAKMPLPLENYPPPADSIIDTIMFRAKAEPFNVAATIIFFLAIFHTFMASTFTKISHKLEHEHEEQLKEAGIQTPKHPEGVPPVSFKATIFHFLGEVEAVFGLWVLALAAASIYFHEWNEFVLYVAKDRNFTEPMFVVVVMAIASSRPVLRFAERMMSKAAALGKGSPSAWWLSVLIIAPILGSFITEPAAMTIGALLLGKKFYRFQPPAKLAYATLGLLFVNISVGGTLTHFAAPPVLMIAEPWSWNTPFMLQHFGWKAVVGIFISCAAYFSYFKKELFKLSDRADGTEDGVVETTSWIERENPIPLWITLVHLIFLTWTVYTAHYPALFVGGFLFFIAFITATQHHQNPLSLRGPILVGFFLGGLVVHGGFQGWWISPLITALDDNLLMVGATILTAFNDNAAITYLAAQVTDISMGAKHAVVAGAVCGGGLTVIANAPNPAGQSILGKYFKDGISPLGLLSGALIPTIIVYVCMAILPNGPAQPDVPVTTHGTPAAIEQHETPAHH
ncbi:MAG: putative Na+/H+ antiporter [Verrucomicrobiales bacterium]|nr:putative Na+/H+ antiporter [Verrucomicrobiota bacterium JB025]